jgi:hypothetical protein
VNLLLHSDGRRALLLRLRGEHSESGERRVTHHGINSREDRDRACRSVASTLKWSDLAESTQRPVGAADRAVAGIVRAVRTVRAVEACVCAVRDEAGADISALRLYS